MERSQCYQAFGSVSGVGDISQVRDEEVSSGSKHWDAEEFKLTFISYFLVLALS